MYSLPHFHRARCKAMLKGLLGALLLAGIATEASAQEYTALEGPPACTECSLSLEPATLVYDESGEAGLTWQPTFLARLESGEVLLVSSEFEPLRFRASGDLIGTLGRQGDGPGEYRSVGSIVVGPADTVWVFDTGLGRRSGWSVDGEFLTSHPVPSGPVSDAVIFDDGSWVTSGGRLEPETIGFPFHRFSPEGEHLISFGPEATLSFEERLRPPPGMRRNLSEASDGSTFWSAHAFRYELDHYSASAERLRGFRRTVPWFTPPDSIVMTPMGDLPPSPRIRSIVQDDEGLLRVAISVPQEDWQSGVGERQEDPRFPGAGVPYVPIEFDQVYDTVLEIIDPETETVLVSHRMDELVMMWVDSEHVATYREDEWDVPIIEIVRIDLDRP